MRLYGYAVIWVTCLMSVLPTYAQSFWTTLSSTENLIVRSITQDSSGMIWFAAGKALYCYDGYDVRTFSSQELDEAGVINCLVYHDNEIAIGCERGLLRFDLKSRMFGKEKAMDGIDVRCISYNYGDEWLGTGSGLYKNMERVVSHLDAYTIYVRDNNVYAGGYSGLWSYDIPTGAIRQSKTDEVVNGSREGGCYAILPCQQRKGPHQNGSADDESIYVGTATGLVTLSVLKMDNCVVEGQYPVIKSLCADAEGNLMIGTDNGLFIRDVEGHDRHIRHDARNSNSLAGNAVWCIFRDRCSNIWFGTDNGISILHHNKTFNVVPIFSITNSSEGNQIYCIHRDTKGRMWIGGTNGVIRIDNLSLLEGVTTSSSDSETTWYKMRDPYHPIPHSRIRAIYDDAMSGVWVGGDGGLLHYNEETMQFDAFRIEEDRNNWVYNITMVRQDSATAIAGAMEVDTYEGCYEIVPNIASGTLSVTKLEKKRQLKPSCQSAVVHNTEWSVNLDGLQMTNLKTEEKQFIRLSDRFVSVYYDMASDKVFLGGSDKIAIMHSQEPSNTSDSDHGVVITNIEINDCENADFSQISAGDLTLKYDENNLLVSFSDFLFSEEKSVCYAFRIDGQQPNWVSLKAGQNTILLPNMSPGTYKLYIARYDEGLNDRADIEPLLVLHITPVWYNSGWAWMVYIMIFLFLAVAAVLYLIQRRTLIIERKRRHVILSRAKEKERMLTEDNETLQRQIRLQMIADAEENTDISQDDQFLMKVTKVIEENIDNSELSVNTLCKMTGFSTKQLYRRIKQMTGMTTVEYIRNLRLKKAAMLLHKDNFTIAEIMYMVGFSNASYFTRSFVREYKMTPTEYQNKNKVNPELP